MPLFEYRCRACGEKTEQLVLAGDTASAPVCSCGSTDLSRLLSTFAAHSGHGPAHDLPCADACPAPGACGSAASPCGGGGCGPFGGYS